MYILKFRSTININKTPVLSIKTKRGFYVKESLMP